jgi:ferric-chelate reductase [NAD(P)H]
MYVVSSFKGERLNAQVANTLFQVASEPRLVAVSINKSNLTHEFIEASGFFTASVVTEAAPMAFIGKFGFRSGRELDKFKDTAFERLASGCPVVLDFCCGYIEAKVSSRHDCGEHSLFIAEVTGMEKTGEGKPMTYDYYHEIKKGKTPQAAPTFQGKAGG